MQMVGKRVHRGLKKLAQRRRHRKPKRRPEVDRARHLQLERLWQTPILDCQTRWQVSRASLPCRPAKLVGVLRLASWRRQLMVRVFACQPFVPWAHGTLGSISSHWYCDAIVVPLRRVRSRSYGRPHAIVGPRLPACHTRTRPLDCCTLGDPKVAFVTTRRSVTRDFATALQHSVPQQHSQRRHARVATIALEATDPWTSGSSCASWIASGRLSRARGAREHALRRGRHAIGRVIAMSVSLHCHSRVCFFPRPPLCGCGPLDTSACRRRRVAIVCRELGLFELLDDDCLSRGGSTKPVDGRDHCVARCW